MEFRGKTIELPGPMALAREGADWRPWYRWSGASIREYATGLGAPAGLVADVVALTSPRVHVSRNVRIARHYLETGALPEGVLPGVKATVEHWETTGRIRGPKSRAFAAALGGDPDAVVIDVWMLRAFRYSQRLTPKRYRALAGRVRGIATRLGWSPAETQAAIWTGARRRFGYVNTGTLNMGGT